MAHESFEDEATARVMNDLFINIKVDREERPDLDKIYQLAHQALTRRGGGWPLTVFLAPDDLVPFYAGTYFPKDARYGMPPFVLRARTGARLLGPAPRRRARADGRAGEFPAIDYERSDATADARSTTRRSARRWRRSQRTSIPTYGGHRGAPKFPHCPEMELLLDYSLTSSARRCRSEWSS